MSKNKSPLLADPQTQSQWFARIRKAHQSETTEDYVELIADLIAANGEARLVDLSTRFGVSHAAVSKIIARLGDEGFIETQPYRSIFLTEKGKNLATHCKERHKIVLNFLIKLGVTHETAEFDAEGIEHHISPETLDIFKKYLA